MKNILMIIVFLFLLFLLFARTSNAGVLDSIHESWRVKMPYDTTEKFMLGAVYATQAGDYMSTKGAFGRGCVEGNSLYGENPSDATLIAGKVFTSLAITWAANNMDDHIWRKILLGASAIAGGGVTYYNSTIECN
jgi:hypothetical protein